MAETASHVRELFEAQYPMRRVLKIWRVPQAKVSVGKPVMSRPETITEEIAHAIIAALGSSENPVEQMLEMVKLLDQAGYKIVRKE